ncbi:MAG: redoxin domain-containing protein [Planctomycetales bacterium]|nr:redoxin domain-containing protein [Planctomycetales bacterium]NIM09087.1 redoxin domain-containing protein [Planctomycetales bacterium]NIN08545.1 redoxin domain-containing protein [Planctomycetales bacterium]NIN77679.1 redoxin domain-containing protein [Planctomycetales bacterium]NIO34845.1 redoxin domain-containing protein [Planctomycetales bacterium]
MSIRTIVALFLSLAAVMANVSCNQAGTAGGRDVAGKKAATSAPVIQRQQPKDQLDQPPKDQLDQPPKDQRETLPEHGSAPHFRVDDGQQEDEAQDPGPDHPAQKLPPIFLSTQHEASCRLKQGDTMPEVELLDIKGKRQSLAALQGRTATVVCFWTSKSPIATWQLSDLEADVVKKYGPQGVAAVVINYKEPLAVVQAAIQKAQLSVPVLMDSKGTVFQQVASDYLPRTYLLDPKGKILWLDIGYSSETQRDLQEAIRYAISLSRHPAP